MSIIHHLSEDQKIRRKMTACIAHKSRRVAGRINDTPLCAECFASARAAMEKSGNTKWAIIVALKSGEMTPEKALVLWNETDHAAEITRRMGELTRLQTTEARRAVLKELPAVILEGMLKRFAAWEPRFRDGARNSGLIGEELRER